MSGVRESNPDQIGGRRVLSPQGHSYFPKVNNSVLSFRSDYDYQLRFWNHSLSLFTGRLYIKYVDGEVTLPLLFGGRSFE